MASTSNGSAYVLRSKPYQTILIDDAHLLEPATLKSLLIRFVRGTKEGLVNRLILFGDPSIKSNLTDCLPFLSDNTAVGNIHLPVMNQAETSQYLSYLLSVAGISQSRLLNRRVVNKIYRSTGGVPGLVKQEAKAWLQRKSEKLTLFSKKDKSSRTSRFRELFKDVSVVSNRLKAGAWLHTIRSENDSRSKTEKSSHNRAIDRNKKPDTLLSPASRRNNQDRLQQMGEALSSRLKPLPPDQIAISIDDIHREEWLLDQDPKCFTLQVLGVKTETALAAIINANKILLDREIACFCTFYKGEKAFPLLWGIYQTQTKASAAIEELPNRLKTFYPLVRPMYAIQHSIHLLDPKY
jgi:hypothetical protein